MRRILALMPTYMAFVLAALPGIHGQVQVDAALPGIDGPVQVDKYVDATAMKCPSPKPDLGSFEKCLPLFNSCMNHGLDRTVCAVNELAVWMCCIMLVGGGVYLAIVFRRIEGAKTKIGDEEVRVTRESQVLMAQSMSPRGESGALMPSRGESGPTASQTGRFIGSRLGALYHKHNELCSALESSQVERDFWKLFGQLLGLWNLVVPAVSIVMQGILKVSDNEHHADTEQYQDTDTINYRDYDLQECARAFRQGSVAVFTIAAIVLQAVSKIFRPDTRTGVLDERVARIQKDKEKFERDVSTVGNSESAHAGNENSDAAGP